MIQLGALERSREDGDLRGPLPPLYGVTAFKSGYCVETEGSASSEFLWAHEDRAMEQLEGSGDVIKRLRLTNREVGVAERAAQLIGDYRRKHRGSWSGPTADTLVKDEVKDMPRQIHILSLACLMERESRHEGS